MKTVHSAIVFLILVLFCAGFVLPDQPVAASEASIMATEPAEAYLAQLGIEEPDYMQVIEDSVFANFPPKNTFAYPSMNRFSRNVLAHLALAAWRADPVETSFFIDAYGKLQIKTTIDYFGTFTFEAITPIHAVSGRLNPLYKKLMPILGQNPHAPEAPLLLVAFVGEVNTGDDLESVLTRAETLASEQGFASEMTAVYDVEYYEDEAGYRSEYIQGNECYLIIPKYERQVFSMMLAEDANEATWQDFGGHYTDLPSTVGTSFLFLANHREEPRIYGAGTIYRKQRAFFELSVDAQDRIVLGGEDAGQPGESIVYDFSDYLQSMELPEYAYYDYHLFEELIVFFGLG